MKVLVTGATGAIGSALSNALRAQDCEVIPTSHGSVGTAWLQVSFDAVPPRDWWTERLRGVDVVVNAVGILRETRQNRFEAVHTQAPIELFHGCIRAGVQHVIQISALGADENAESAFHRTKKAADDALRSMPIASTIVQPSLVYGPGVASAAFFDRLALLPWIALPRGGTSLVQPIALEDVVEGLTKLVKTPAAGCVTVAFVGPEALTLRRYLEILRERLGATPRQYVLCLPDRVALLGARLMDAWPRAPFTSDAVAMLLRGNTAAADGMTRLLGRAPRSLLASFEIRADVTRRHEALLSLWLTPLRGIVALLWIWTGMVSLGLYPQTDSLALLASVGMSGSLAWWALYGAAALDLALGIAVFCTHGQTRRWIWLAQLATMMAYTAILSLQAPHWWLHPFGPLSKNLPVAALIGLLWAFEPLPPRRKSWQPVTDSVVARRALH